MSIGMKAFLIFLKQKKQFGTEEIIFKQSVLSLQTSLFTFSIAFLFSLLYYLCFVISVSLHISSNPSLSPLHVS